MLFSHVFRWSTRRYPGFCDDDPQALFTHHIDSRNVHLWIEISLDPSILQEAKGVTHVKHTPGLFGGRVRRQHQITVGRQVESFK